MGLRGFLKNQEQLTRVLIGSLPREEKKDGKCSFRDPCVYVACSAVGSRHFPLFQEEGMLFSRFKEPYWGLENETLFCGVLAGRQEFGNLLWPVHLFSGHRPLE